MSLKVTIVFENKLNFKAYMNKCRKIQIIQAYKRITAEQILS